MPAGRAAAKKGKRRRLSLKNMFRLAVLCQKAGSENIGGQGCGEKGKYRGV